MQIRNICHFSIKFSQFMLCPPTYTGSKVSTLNSTVVCWLDQLVSASVYFSILALTAASEKFMVILKVMHVLCLRGWGGGGVGGEC